MKHHFVIDENGDLGFDPPLETDPNLSESALTPGSTECCNLGDNKGKPHCYHVKHHLTSMPPVVVSACCWCGDIKKERILADWSKHGPFK